MPDEEGLENVENILINSYQGPAGQEVRPQSDRADTVWRRAGG